MISTSSSDQLSPTIITASAANEVDDDVGTEDLHSCIPINPHNIERQHDSEQFQQQQQQQQQHPMRSYYPYRQILRWLIAIGLMSCIIYVVVDFCGNRTIESKLSMFLEWVHRNPYKGIFAITLCYIIATILFVPGSILTLGAGFAIGSAVENTFVGVLLATASVFIGASIGSICSFLLGRYLFRDCVLQLAFSYPIFQAIERALEGNGLKIMVLLRLSPLIPFNALDYVSGVTSISLRDYTIALVAILPGALLLCFVGASASSLSDATTTSTGKTVKIITIVSGILFGGCGVWMASYYSKQELDLILTAQPEIYSTMDGADADDNYDNSSQELLSTNGIISHDAEESIETNQVV